MIAYRDFFKRTIISMIATIRIWSIAIIMLCIHHTPTHADWFKPTAQPENILELIPKKKTSVLYIEHELSGSINVQGWRQDHILVTIHKHTYTKDDADRIHAILTQTEHGVITLKIAESEELRKHAHVDITVHIPQQIATTITAQDSVVITETLGAMRVETKNGTITAENTRGNLHLETENGDIKITDARGTIHAQTERGSIVITESYNSITAETERGSLNVSAARVPSTAHIDLRTQKRGTITLALPESAQAHIIADTTRGVITSDLLVTVESHTTVLNSGTYQDLQRHLRGTIGSQATAEIRLSGTRDIHITTSEPDTKKE